MVTLTKHAHACVEVEQDGETVLIDPGAFTPDRARLLETAGAVLVTHEHFDHFDADALAAALRARRDLQAFGPASVVAALQEAGIGPDQAVRVEDGDAFEVHGVAVRVVVGHHAEIHDGIAVPSNAGYLVAGRVFHPGDSYTVPPFAVGTLLVPASGPWTKTGEAIDFVTAVAPERSVPIHGAMLSEIGASSVARFLGPDGLTGTPLTALADGESLEV